MALLQVNQGQTGKQTGQGIIAGAGEYSEVLVNELQARYYQNAYRGNVFLASGQALVLTGVGLVSSSSTGMNLYNPAGSGRNLVLLDAIVNWALPVAYAQANFLIWLTACLSPTQAAPVVIGAVTAQCSLLGTSGGAKGVASTQATLPTTPVVIRQLGSALIETGGTTVAGMTCALAGFFKDEIAGAIIIPPGIAVAIQTNAAMSMCASMTWAELPQ